MVSQSPLADIFCEVYQLPPAERARRIAELTGTNEELAAQIHDLIESYERNPDFLETPVVLPVGLFENDQTAALAGGELHLNSTVGPYRIVSPLGQGGMGVVYLAEQTAPIHRRLALKVLSRQKVSPSSIARFEIERQTLALLNHPYIATVFDGGTIDEKYPFFVMEFVDGQSLDDLLCGENMPDFQARIDLFLKICEAIRHAHQKGVIHRDIKPSNILVTRRDVELVPKVIDFGLAKWLGENAGMAPHESGEIRVIGTLPYVSPEQLQESIQAADVRSDIYSLGTVLYLLIAGATPFSRKSNSPLGGDLELIRRIREEEAVRPSLFVKQDAPAGQNRFQAELNKLPRSLVDDLDWISLKCLEKDAGRRYESVAELKADIRAALANMPVQAGPPSVRQRLKKYIRRNKIQISGVVMASVMVMLLGVSYMQTRQAWQLASSRLQETTDANRRLETALADSEKFRDEAEKVSAFLVSTFASPRPGKSGGDLRVVDFIRDSIRSLMTSFEGNQASRGKLLLTLGNTLRAMGEYEEALPPLEMALKIEAEELGETAAATVSSVCQIGKSLNALKRYEETVALYSKWRKPLEQAGLRKTQQYETIMYNLGRTYMAQERYDDALSIFKELEALFPEIPKALPFELAMIRQAMAQIYSMRGDKSGAIAIQRVSLEDIAKDLGTDHPHTMTARHQLAMMLIPASPAEAEELFRINEVSIRKKYTPEMPLFKSRMSDLATAFGKLGKPGDEKRILDELENLPKKTNNRSGKN